MKNQEQVVYTVLILKRDQNHITVVESEDFSVCRSKWVTLHTQWQECHKEGKVFVLEDPVLSAFEPGMIYEISLVPKTSTMNISSDNPYQKNMQQKGLPQTMRGADMLDNGYK